MRKIIRPTPKQIDMEVWKEVEGTNGVYYISSNGRLKTTNWRNAKLERIMLPSEDKKGYLRTSIVLSGKNKTVKLHRLVAKAFIPNPDNKPQVNHIDGNKTNNSVDNLEWVTGSENVLHAIRNGLIKIPYCIIEKKAKGSKNGFSKLTEIQVKEIRMKFKPRVYTRKMLADEYGVSPHTIKDVILRRWRHVQ